MHTDSTSRKLKIDTQKKQDVNNGHTRTLDSIKHILDMK